MRKVFVLMSLMLGAACPSAFAAATDYDGKWELAGGCSAAIGVRYGEPINFRLPTTIKRKLFGNPTKPLSWRNSGRSMVR